MAEAPPSPPARRISTPRWLDLRLVLGVVLVLGSVLAGATIFSRARSTHAVVSTTRDLAAGTILTASDVSVAQVQVPDRGIYLTKTDDAIGKMLSRPMSRGELLATGAIAGPARTTTLTVPFAAGTAPDLRAGQRIEVWVSTSTCSSLVLLSDVTVQTVRVDSGGSFGTGTGDQDVVVSVSPTLASRVISALALDGVKLRAGVLVNAPAPTPSPRSTASGGAAPQLPDLRPCSSASPSEDQSGSPSR